MSKLSEYWFSYLFIVLWVIAYLLCQKFNLLDRFANEGMNRIGTCYYRFGTALLLHSNFLHLLVNVLGMYFVGRYLEPQICSWKLLSFSVLIGIATNALFSAIYRNSVSVGGSPIVFSLIGLIVALQITHTDAFEFKLGTWYGNCILCYALLSNIPLFSTSFTSTLLIHALPTVIGIVLGYVFITLKLL